ncbi:MAG: gas vesicle protein GvpG [Proteobacteria bacterium]|nr:gas vesicle protein GvpG [Pseudomonadota bacterium]
MFIVDDIVLSPLKGLIWLSEKINDMVQREMSDEGLIKERLMELQLRFELDEIDEEAYTRQEKELLERLDAIHGEEDATPTYRGT